MHSSRSRLYKIMQRRRNRKENRLKSPSHKVQTLLLGVAAIISVAFIIFILFGIYQYIGIVQGLPSLELLPTLLDRDSGTLLQPTMFLDRSGNYTLFTMQNAGEQRKFMTVNPDEPDHFSPKLIQVSVATLDPEYWRSPGFSWQNLFAPQPLTIPEKLVNDLLLDQEQEGLKRSLRMRMLASQIISEYGWMQVLEWYLNSAYFGHMTYGAENAAQLYLGKSASNLSISEIALLMALIDAPALNPIDAPGAVLEQHQRALDKMLIAGAIDTLEYELSIKSPPIFPDFQHIKNIPAQSFIQISMQQLEEEFSQKQIERGGLRILTTLDYEIQQQLTCSIQVQMQRLEGLAAAEDYQIETSCPSALLLPTLSPGSKTIPDSLSSSGLVLDPQTGEILAFLDQTTHNGTNTNITMQPGSLLSPFVAMAGLTRGSTPATLFWDIPEILSETFQGLQNPDGSFHGPVSLREAVINDYLVAVVQQLDQVGIENTWRLVESMGFNNLKTSSPELILTGGSQVSTLEIAHSYSIFANQGWQRGWQSYGNGIAPKIIYKVQQANGQLWSESQVPAEQSVLSPQVSYLVHDMLSDSITRQDSLGFPNPTEIGRPSGVKTGQIASGKQVWTVGYTPDLLTVIWLGLPDEDRDTQLSYRMSAGIWHAIMQYLHRDKPIANWDIPQGITQMEVCDPSGLLPTRNCLLTKSEVFVEGNQPASYDSLYQQFRINRETGLLATAFTPLEQVEEHVFLVPPPEALEWARLSNISLPPDGYDSFQMPLPDPFVNIINPQPYSYIQDEIDIRGTASGENFESYRIQVGSGLNPENWQQIGQDISHPVNDDILETWSTGNLKDGLYTIRLTVLREDQQIDTALNQVIVDNTNPIAYITYPYPELEIDHSEKDEIILLAEAEDDFGIQELKWYIDGVHLGTTSQEPYIMPWESLKGDHTLTVTAIDLAGNEDQTSLLFFVR